MDTSSFKELLSPKVKEAKKKIYKAFVVFSMATLILNMSLVGVFFVFNPISVEAVTTPTVIFTDGFGMGDTDSTFNESPAWSEGGDGAEKRKAGSGNDSDSPDGGRFAVMSGDNGWICTTVNASSRQSL